MTAADTALARLNFFNGQRLEASDLRAEQGYHLQVRRRLTRALFTPGIAAGLEVNRSAANPHAVIVSPGIAIDHLGREIILLEAREMLVIGAPAPLDGVAFGNFVAIEYGEELTAPVLSACTPKGALAGRGAPSRILLDPRIVFLDRWPAEGSGRIVLAQVELEQNCVVGRINSGVRRYVSAAKPPRTRAITLEGEKDIDATNPKVLRFHVEGDYPSSAQLYLYAAQFSSIHYTEIGRHSHGIDLPTNSQTLSLRHTHTLGQAPQTDPAGDHAHDLLVDKEDTEPPVDLDSVDLEDRIWLPGLIRGVEGHRHPISGLSLNDALGDSAVQLRVTGATGGAGAADAPARAGNRLRYVDNLRVIFDGQDITPQILAQLSARPGQAGAWAKLGDGTQAHRIASAEGTGAIDLVAVGVVDLSPGQRHELRFVVANGGGQVAYNLYVA